MTVTKLALVGALALVAGSALAQQNLNLPINGSVGIFFPTDSEMRHIMGNSVLSFGIGAGSLKRPREGTITPSISLISSSNNGNKVLLIPYTEGYEFHFGQNSNVSTGALNITPYARIGAGVVYYDYSLTNDAGEHLGTKRLGGAATAELGVLVNQTTRLSVGYYLFTKTDSLNFNGLQLNLTFTAFHL